MDATEKKQFNVDAGYRLMEERKSLNLSRKYVADALGIGADSYYRIEMGETTIVSYHYPELYKLGVDIDYVIVGKKRTEGNELIETYRAADSKSKRLLKIYMNEEENRTLSDKLSGEGK